MAGDIGDPELYQKLRPKLTGDRGERHTGGNVLFYLSTQPSQYAPAALRDRRRREWARATAGGG